MNLSITLCTDRKYSAYTFEFRCTGNYICRHIHGYIHIPHIIKGHNTHKTHSESSFGCVRDL